MLHCQSELYALTDMHMMKVCLSTIKPNHWANLLKDVYRVVENSCKVSNYFGLIFFSASPYCPGVHVHIHRMRDVAKYTTVIAGASP